VDEIYGNIWVSANFASQLSFQTSLRLPGWRRASIWQADEPFNLGRYPQTVLATIRIDGERLGTDVNVKVHFDIDDHDDDIFNAKDEFFFVGKNTIHFGYSNFRAFNFTPPTCDESPEFERSTQQQVIGEAAGTASGNKVTLIVRITWSRKYD